MYQKVIYGIHTGDYKHKISAKEARYIKTALGFRLNDIITENESLKRNGITFSIIEQRKLNMGTGTNTTPKTYNGTNYYLFIRLNHSCVIGDNGNLVMELSAKNIKKTIKEINRILSTVFKLEAINADFTSWSIERIDDAFDLYLYDDPRLLVYLLNASLQLPTNTHCTYHKEYEMTPDCDRAFESVYFFNNSYAINAYAKWYELKKQHPNILESDPTYNLMRIERQSGQQYLKGYFPNRTVNDMQNMTNIMNMRSSLKDSIKTFWGTGDFCDEVFHAKYSMIAMLDRRSLSYDDYLKASNDLMNGGRLYTHQNMDKYVLGWFADRQLAPAIITPSARYKLGILYKCPSHIMGLYNMIDQGFPDQVKKKLYHSFAVPHPDEKRGDWRVSMTVHIHSVKKGEPDSACGKTFDDCQKVMFIKLKQYYETNNMCGVNNDGLRNDFKNFYKTVKSRKLRREIREYLERNGEEYA